MSAAPLQNARSERRLGRWWRRWCYHLSALLILLPVAFTPLYLSAGAARRGGTEGLHRYGPIAVGPWTASLYDTPGFSSVSQGPAGEGRSIVVEPCVSCVKQIRAVFLRLGKPRSSRAYGAPVNGNPYRGRSLLLIPPRAKADEKLWITAEGWDGSVHQASVPLAEALPTTAAWITKRGGNP